MTRPEGEPLADERIEAARAGSDEALGQALEACRRYLLLVADRGLPEALRAKAGPSDLVQETFLVARRKFSHFQGRTEEELLAWLRVILKHKVAHLRRRYRVKGRDVEAEEPIDGRDGPGPGIEGQTTSPVDRAIRHEEADRLHDALGRLTERDRRIILRRQGDRLTFDEIGREFGISAVAARKAWLKAIERLQAEFGGPPDESDGAEAGIGRPR